MKNHTFSDITILTDARYVNPARRNDYIRNVLDEDRLLQEALERKELKVNRINWDHPLYDWSSTRFIVFRTTWDYFDRFPEFEKWLNKVHEKTILINPKSLIYWNIDKHYLKDLQNAGVHIPPTLFVEQGDQRPLSEITSSVTWKRFILKPAVSGAARHTYKFSRDAVREHEDIYRELIGNESMLLQEYQDQITSKGEVSYMLFGGKFSHAILKKAKAGDFRVQDDFGGTVHPYTPTPEEIAFAEKAVRACNPVPVYARADVFWDNNDSLILGELELIEPELWFRMNPQAADRCATAIIDFMNR